jgi:hypothetical protein
MLLTVRKGILILSQEDSNHLAGFEHEVVELANRGRKGDDAVASSYGQDLGPFLNLASAGHRYI